LDAFAVQLALSLQRARLAEAAQAAEASADRAVLRNTLLASISHDLRTPLSAIAGAGSLIAHGRIADEVEALKGIGMSPTAALGAACWDAREWLGRPGLDHGAAADLLCYAEDPRQGPGVLTQPDLVILRGNTFRP